MNRIKGLQNVGLLIIPAILALAVVGCSNGGGTERKQLKQVEMEHIHGIGYSPDGQKLYFAAHDGLRLYEKGQWIQPAGEKHDYMGFSLVDDGFYSSGHPAPGSEKKNPLGIVKSRDEGKSLEPLTLYGETDFHGMSVGYKSHTIYLFNTEPNNLIQTLGLHYSMDEGKTWTRSKMNGLDGNPTAIAVHPSDNAAVALGTEKGVFVSRDFGQRFEPLSTDMQVTSLAFDGNNKLLVGATRNEPVLIQIDMTDQKEARLDLSVMDRDAIAFIARNPVDEREISIVTFGNNAYTSRDFGQNWIKFVDQGQGKSG